MVLVSKYVLVRKTNRVSARLPIIYHDLKKGQPILKDTRDFDKGTRCLYLETCHAPISLERLLGKRCMKNTNTTATIMFETTFIHNV